MLCEARNPVHVITKNHLVTRDIDLLGELARQRLAAVCVSLPTIDGALSRVLEPRTTQPHRRLDAVARLADAGIPVVVLVAPVIPGLTDHEIPAIIDAARQAGATHAGYVTLRLPLAVGAAVQRLARGAPPQPRAQGAEAGPRPARRCVE